MLHNDGNNDHEPTVSDEMDTETYIAHSRRKWGTILHNGASKLHEHQYVYVCQVVTLSNTLCYIIVI